MSQPRAQRWWRTAHDMLAASDVFALPAPALAFFDDMLEFRDTASQPVRQIYQANNLHIQQISWTCCPCALLNVLAIKGGHPPAAAKNSTTRL